MKKEGFVYCETGVTRVTLEDDPCGIEATLPTGVDQDINALYSALLDKGYKLITVTVKQLACPACRRLL